MDNLIKGIHKAVETHFAGRTILEILDRGFWIRHCFEVRLDDGTVLFFKVKTHPDWGEVWHEANVADIFLRHRLPAPRVMLVDESCSLLPYPYLVQEKIGGTKLGDLSGLPINEQQAIYQCIGELYGRMHQVTNAQNGLWSRDPRKPLFPIHPTDYMFNAEIVNGSGKRAMEEGFINQTLYEEIVAVWKANLDDLKSHAPAMIHVSPFHWNIYLEKSGGQWNVTKLMSLCDVLWWDPAYDIATLKYPPYGRFDELLWQAFLVGYGKEPEEKRILLYAIMHRLCATMNTYMEPPKYTSREWKLDCSRTIREYLGKITESSGK